jgi:hypothetical protein
VRQKKEKAEAKKVEKGENSKMLKNINKIRPSTPLPSGCSIRGSICCFN